MFRLLFVMVVTILLGVGSGYFLWGSRVARLTESLSGLTLELDTMRARLAAPRAGAETDASAARTADELHVINETINSIRQDLATQKESIAKAAEVAVPADVASVEGELRRARNELVECLADKADLELRRAPAAPAAPSPAYTAPVPAVPPAPQPYTAPPLPRYRPPATPPGSPGLDDPRY